MKKENFIKKASKLSIEKEIKRIQEKYNKTEDEAKKYLLSQIDCVAKSQAGERVGWNEEGAIVFYNYAMRSLFAAKKEAKKHNKRLLFLVEICIKVNGSMLSNLALTKGKYMSEINIYSSWSHIAFSTGDILYSSCGGGNSYNLKTIYNNFEEFAEIVMESNPEVHTELNAEAKNKAIDEQGKRIGININKYITKKK